MRRSVEDDVTVQNIRASLVSGLVSPKHINIVKSPDRSGLQGCECFPFPAQQRPGVQSLARLWGLDTCEEGTGKCGLL